MNEVRKEGTKIEVTSNSSNLSDLDDHSLSDDLFEVIKKQSVY